MDEWEAREMRETADRLSGALEAVEELRSSAAGVFAKLAEGAPDGSAAEFVAGLRRATAAVALALVEVELATAALATPAAAELALTEGGPLWLRAVSARRLMGGVRERAEIAHSVVGANSLKRTQSNTIFAKKPRVHRGGHRFLPQFVDGVLASLAALHPDMKFNVPHSLTTTSALRVIRIGLGRTLRAIVGMKGLTVETVQLRGVDEPPDLWLESRHLVFRKATEHAHAALLHYHSPLRAETALRSFAAWLHSLVNLFSEPCRRCERILRDGLPPTWRDFRTLEPYHEHCKH